ncbi:glycosyltransferase family A protein [Thiobacillus denitrificans]|uniref:glycosyltransferase family A protein n=1 Tax=Thiobacillus denitrificans TaxID=36861 RepID=UPI000372ACFE|nr:glycosyltransferase family A protein [Thiobacillus denitrificans]
MANWQLKTPVAFIIFNRPETTERVFAEIAKVKPPKLLVVADGPRPDRPGELEKCAATREVIKRVDWECEVLTNFSDVNLGCRNRPASGIDWVFEQVPEAIILEDDCLPHPSFFRFCEELLERYRDDERIGLISGDNFQFGRKRGEASYYFSRYNHIWGWASWRRAWRHYDRDASLWPAFRDGGWLDALVNTHSERRHWAKAFDAVFEDQLDAWDYQWTLALWSQGMVSALPNVNLISNIGFGADATHTHKVSVYADMPVEPIEFPLRHPKIVLPHPEADTFTGRRSFSTSVAGMVLQELRNISLRFRAR